MASLSKESFGMGWVELNDRVWADATARPTGPGSEDHQTIERFLKAWAYRDEHGDW